MNITSPGTYSAGSYTLLNDISVSSGNGLVFTGPATLDLNGFTVSTSQTGDVWDYGVKFEGDNSSISNGSVTGFRVGARVDGDNSSSINVDYSGNRYMGIQVEGDGFNIAGGEASDIAGVTDENYAIGVQLGNCTGCSVSGVTFRNLAPQGVPVLPGEGLAINLSSNCSGCTVQSLGIRNGNPGYLARVGCRRDS